MSIKRSASAVWKGGLKDGSGTVSTDSGVLRETAYSFHTRFEDGQGTNPEELVGAAHAGCFSMALSAELGKANMKADSIETKATVQLDQQGGGFAVTQVHLDVQVSIPGADPAAFEQAAQSAKANCPISKLLNTNITMDAKLSA